MPAPDPAALAPRSFPLAVLLTAALPILLVGSESRQWLYFFPVMVTLVALNERSAGRWLLLLGTSVALCLPSVTLNPALIARATRDDVIEQMNEYKIIGIVDIKENIGKKVLDYEIIGSDDD